MRHLPKKAGAAFAVVSDNTHTIKSEVKLVASRLQNMSDLKLNILVISVCLVWLILNTAAGIAAARLHNERITKVCRIANFSALCVCTCLLLYSTLLGRKVQEQRTTSLVPFSIIGKVFTVKNSGREKMLNIYAFIPIGLTLSGAMKERTSKKYLTAFLVGTAFSVFIETMQYIFAVGLAETDDVIVNSLGTLIGVVICIISDVIIRLASRKFGSAKEE